MFYEYNRRNCFEDESVWFTSLKLSYVICKSGCMVRLGGKPKSANPLSNPLSNPGFTPKSPNLHYKILNPLRLVSIYVIFIDIESFILNTKVLNIVEH